MRDTPCPVVVLCSYLAITVPAISLRHTAAVLLFTRPKSEPPFGVDETATFAGLLREHMMIAIHAASRNDAMLRTLDLLLTSVRQLGHARPWIGALWPVGTDCEPEP